MSQAPSSRKNRDEMRETLLSLVCGEVFDTEMPGCPLHEVRKKPLRERMHWVAGLDDQQVVEIMIHHHNCAFVRDLEIRDALRNKFQSQLSGGGAAPAP